MGWWNKIRLRRKIIGELKGRKRILEVKKWSLHMQLMQIESRTPRPFSFPYRIKFMELLDIDEELGKVDYALKQCNLWFVLTGSYV